MHSSFENLLKAFLSKSQLHSDREWRRSDPFSTQRLVTELILPFKEGKKKPKIGVKVNGSITKITRDPYIANDEDIHVSVINGDFKVGLDSTLDNYMNM